MVSQTRQIWPYTDNGSLLYCGVTKNEDPSLKCLDVHRAHSNLQHNVNLISEGFYPTRLTESALYLTPQYTHNV